MYQQQQAARTSRSSVAQMRRASSTAVVFAVLAAALSAVPQQAAAVTPLGSWQNGVATNYGGPADGMSDGSPSFGTLAGSCGYGLLDKGTYPYWSVAALATSSPFYSAGPLNGCGQCFQIECLSTVDESKGTCSSNPSVTVMISDECPECASDQIDMQAATFNKVAPESIGRINMRYRRVECTPPADMKVDITDNRGAGGWIRMSVQQTGGRGAVQQVQVLGSGSSGWTTLNNIFGGVWELPSVPSGSLSFRFSPDQGPAVTANNVLSGSATGMLPTHVQFVMHDRPGGNGSSSSAPAAQVEAFSGPPDSAAPPNSSSSSSSSSSPSNGSPPPPPPSPSSSGSGSSPPGPSDSGSSSPPSYSDSAASGRRRLRGSSSL